MTTRLLVVDDHGPFRAGLRNTLDDVDDIDVVGECADGACAIDSMLTLFPDVILMDIQMPGLNGIDTTRTIVTSAPQVSVIMLTMFDNDESVFSAMRAGARGYLLKGAGKDEIVRAVRAAAHGEAVFGPSLARRMQSYFTGAARFAETQPANALPALTEREREVLELLARGNSTAEIAQALIGQRKDGAQSPVEHL